MGYIKNETCLFFFKQKARGVFWGQILNTRERDKETMVSGTAVIPERDGGGEHRM